LSDAPEPPALGVNAFAREVGLTHGRISQLVRQGLPRGDDGKIPVTAGKAWIAANVRMRVKQTATDSDARIASRAERERHEAELARLKVEERAGRFVPKDEVRAAAYERARFERDAHLGFVARLAPTLAAELGVDQARVFAILDREMRDHLTRLADTALEVKP
jgi:hypothetical protein